MPQKSDIPFSIPKLLNATPDKNILVVNPISVTGSLAVSTLTGVPSQSAKNELQKETISIIKQMGFES